MKYTDLKSKKLHRSGRKRRSKASINSVAGPSKGTKIARYIFAFLLLVTLGVVLTFVFSDKARALFDPVSIVASFNNAELDQADGRTNILLLGSDRRAEDPKDIPQRADTILVASIGRIDNNLVLISIPRDLWVSSPVCGRCKITEVYAYATINKSELTPEEAIQTAVEEVLDIPIHYYGVINFELFKDVINTLGGVKVNVDQAFDDYEYPQEGKEADLCGRTQEEVDMVVEKGESLLSIVPCRYEHISFTVGMHEMDGETALKFARSRHGTNNEGTDFARSARQQKVIMAVKSKATSLGTLLNPKKVQELYALYKDTITTNVDFGTLQEFYLLSQKVDFAGVRTIVLDDRSAANEGGLLYSPVDTIYYGGKYVLLPRAGNFSQVHAYVQKFLFGE